jgi:hypothetical protein
MNCRLGTSTGRATVIVTAIATSTSGIVRIVCKAQLVATVDACWSERTAVFDRAYAIMAARAPTTRSASPRRTPNFFIFA